MGKAGFVTTENNRNLVMSAFFRPWGTRIELRMQPMTDDHVSLLREVRDELRATRESHKRTNEEFVNERRREHARPTTHTRSDAARTPDCQNRISWPIIAAFGLGAVTTLGASATALAIRVF